MTQAAPTPPKRSYYCRKCNKSVGDVMLQKCPHCRAHAMISAGQPPAGANSFHEEKPVLLRDVPDQNVKRISTNTREFDRVLGGGLVIGSSILISGDPGIGKSTLLLQTAMDLTDAEIIDEETNKVTDPLVCLYVSAEETNSQVKGRSQRLSRVPSKHLHIYHQHDVLEIDRRVQEIRPDVLYIDSIQTMIHPNVEGGAGSIAQVRACADHIVNMCKARDIVCFLVAHINKEGVVAGPKTLEHLVDATLEFHKQGHGELRSVTATKNRFGDTNEQALFRMTSVGLLSVENPSELLLEGHKDGECGSCLGVVVQGTRGMVVEIQTLIAPAIPVEIEEYLDAFEQEDVRGRIRGYLEAAKALQKHEKRHCTGVPAERVNQILAVLKRCCGLDVRGEVWVSLAGHPRLDDQELTSLDVPIALSIASAALNVALPPKFVAFGEVGLLGEVRRVSYMDVRIKQGAIMDYDVILGPIAPDYEAAIAEVGEEEDEEKNEEKKADVVAADVAPESGTPDFATVLAQSDPPPQHEETPLERLSHTFGTLTDRDETDEDEDEEEEEIEEEDEDEDGAEEEDDEEDEDDDSDDDDDDDADDSRYFDVATLEEAFKLLRFKVVTHEKAKQSRKPKKRAAKADEKSKKQGNSAAAE